MRQKRPTLADVARLAGLSPTAASQILNGTPETRFSEDSHRRVLAAAAELGYRPNMGARALRTDRSLTIGFISDVVATTRFASGLIRGALVEAERAGARRARARDRWRRGARGRGRVRGARPPGRRHRLRHDARTGARRPRRARLDARRDAQRHQPPPRQLRAAGRGGGRTPRGRPPRRRRPLRWDRAPRQRHRDRAEPLPLGDGGASPARDPRGDGRARPALRGRAVVRGLGAGRRLRGRGRDPGRGARDPRDPLPERPPGIRGVPGVPGARDPRRHRRLARRCRNDELASYLRPGLTTIALPHEEMGREAVRLVLRDAEPGERLVGMPVVERGSIAPVTPADSGTARVAAARMAALAASA